MTPQEIGQYVAAGIHAGLSPRNEIISFQGKAVKVDFNGAVEKVDEYHMQFVPHPDENIKLAYLDKAIRSFAQTLAPDNLHGIVAFLVPQADEHDAKIWFWEYYCNVGVRVIVRPCENDRLHYTLSVWAASHRDNLFPHQREMMVRAESRGGHTWLMHEYPWLRDVNDYKIKLPPTEVFYRRAMQRSAELKAESEFFNEQLGEPWKPPPEVDEAERRRRDKADSAWLARRNAELLGYTRPPDE